MLINEPFIHYLVEFHVTRDFFECHEIMEEHWKNTPQNEYTHLWVAFIQIAVAQYHDRRQNKRGAELMYRSAHEKLLEYRKRVSDIDIFQLCSDIEARLNDMNAPFYNLNMIIVNKQLLHACYEAAEKRQLKWDMASEKISEDVIHRHKTRDRSGVIAEREAALKHKHMLKKHK